MDYFVFLLDCLSKQECKSRLSIPKFSGSHFIRSFFRLNKLLIKKSFNFVKRFIGSVSLLQSRKLFKMVDRADLLTLPEVFK